MKKEILLLASRGGSGKTTTIDMLYKDFIDEYKSCIDKKDKVEEKGNSKDFKAIVCIEKDITICFASQGDTEKIVKENCKFFQGERDVKNNVNDPKEKECNICITATRIKHNTKTTMLAFAGSEGYDISLFDFIDKYFTAKTEEKVDNEEVCKNASKQKVRMMLDRLRYLIDECEKK